MATPTRRQPAAAKRAPWRVLVIGISTGGPQALGTFVPALPADFSLPVLIVQHMPAGFTRQLAERLADQSRIKVEEAQEGSLVAPGKVLIAPGDYHMKLRRHSGQVLATLDQGPLENSCRPAVDVLFRSVAEVYGGGAVAAILTGMGRDGVLGAKALRAVGSHIIAQDEATSTVWGMPGAVVQAGLADTVLPLPEIVPTLMRQI